MRVQIPHPPTILHEVNMQNALFTQKPSIIPLPQRPDDDLSVSDTPDDAVKKFMKANSHLARTTLEFYQHALNRFIVFCSTHGLYLIPDDLTADQISGNLQVHEIDLAARTAWIKTSKTMPRPVFFSDATAKLLEHTITYTKRQLIISDSQRLFPSDGQIKAIVSEILEGLGLKKGDRDGRGAHTFRHYCATWLYYEGGMDLNDLAVYLGDEPATIRENYLHPTPKMMRKRVEKALGWS